MLSRNIRDGITHYFLTFNGKKKTFQEFEDFITKRREFFIARHIDPYHHLNRLDHWKQNRTEINNYFLELKEKYAKPGV